jgi:hypothetical protein
MIPFDAILKSQILRRPWASWVSETLISIGHLKKKREKVRTSRMKRTGMASVRLVAGRRHDWYVLDEYLEGEVRARHGVGLRLGLIPMTVGSAQEFSLGLGITGCGSDREPNPVDQGVHAILLNERRK